MGTEKQTPYITEWIPLVAGFRPAQVILEHNGKQYQPRKEGKWIMNKKWLENEMARCLKNGVKCFIDEKEVNGIIMLALKEGVENEKNK